MDWPNAAQDKTAIADFRGIIFIGAASSGVLKSQVESSCVVSQVGGAEQNATAAASPQ